MDATAGTDPTASLRTFLDEDDLRIEQIMEPLRARYVESDRDDVIRKQIKKLHRNACARRNPRLPPADANRRNGIGFAVIAESGSGKSTTLDRVFRDYPAFEGYGTVGSDCPILSVEAPSPCTLKQLAMIIVEKLGYASSRDLKENVAWKRARTMLKLHKVFFLHIDEAANVLHQANEHEIRKVADTFRGLLLSRDWPIQLVLSGVPELDGLFDVDRQLRRRLQYVRFENLSAKDDAEPVEEAVRAYAKAAKLKVEFSRDDMLIGRLCHAAVYQFGLVMEIIVEAIECCLTDGRAALTIGDFANAYAGRTLQPIELNPFIAPAWDTIDCSAIRKKATLPTVDDGQTSAKRRGRKR